MNISKFLIIGLFVCLAACKNNQETNYRPVIKNNTLCSYDNEILRGTALWLYRYGIAHHENLYTLDTLYWLKNKEFGLNCFRVICFDPWERKRNYISMDLDDTLQRETFLSHLDSIVRISEKLKMYVIINYHDCGDFQKDYITKFWALVAPRYAKNEFVIFELFNEPVEWFPKHYDQRFIAFQDNLYEKVRFWAPETKTILFSFANTVNPYGGRPSMTDVVNKSNIRNWDNCLVGFHPYNTGHSSESIVELKENYPVFNTEQNIPGDPDIKIMDKEEWGIQTMERLGIGWCGWSMEDYSNFKSNFINGAYKDAVTKDYYWK